MNFAVLGPTTDQVASRRYDQFCWTKLCVGRESAAPFPRFTYLVQFR